LYFKTINLRKQWEDKISNAMDYEQSKIQSGLLGLSVRKR
jgi:hypothetical protein